jgi:peptidoglycan/LPS O-acetylase OafA/YrhL
MPIRKRLVVERHEAENYILISLVAFAVTIILVRAFLELTGYPQIGNSTLHIAHLLWGGLLLFVGVMIALIWDNPSFMRVAAALSGVGIGLFIDEVGKFITQNNDYFFPAAAPIIYGFFLLTVLLFIFVRQPDGHDPRRSLVIALEQLQDAIYAELDEEEVKELVHNLKTAGQSDRREIRQLAILLESYVEAGNVPFRNYEPGIAQRLSSFIEHWGRRLGRHGHRIVIMAGLVIIAFSAVATLAGLIWVAVSPAATTQTWIAGLAAEAQQTDVQSVAGNFLRYVLEFGVGIVALVSLYYFLNGNDRRGSVSAIIAVVLALTAVQLITFYLEQFTAIVPTLYQFGFLLLVLSFQRWYVDAEYETKDVKT